MNDNKNNNGPSSSSGTVVQEKGLYEALIFLAAILSGTLCSITSKVLYTLTDSGGRHFDKPMIQTLAMFVAMIFGLPLHALVVRFRISFPGYDQYQESDESTFSNENQDLALKLQDPDKTPRMGAKVFDNIRNEDDEESFLLQKARSKESSTNSELATKYATSEPHIPLRTYLYLILPALFDCVATALCMVGLLYLDVSIYQLLRGSGIIFVAILRQSVLQQQLYRFQWCGVAWNVVSVVLVGMTAVLISSNRQDEQNDTTMPLENSAHSSALIGVAFMLAGTLVQSMMFVFEEKVMTQDAIKVPPLLLFGMEGLWGAILTIVFLYPIGFYVPGYDHGSFENPWTTWEMLCHSSQIQFVMVLYCLSVFGYNLFAVLVTFSLSSIWHSILDNFRPMTVWFTDLFLFYVVTAHQFGEPWNAYSWIQLCGLAVLVYGTAIYNAPDVGSIELRGGWSSLGVLDFSEEYDEIRAHRLFSMGSYPSLQRFLHSSLRGGPLRLSSGIGYAQRAHTVRERASQKMHDYDAISTEQHSI